MFGVSKLKLLSRWLDDDKKASGKGKKGAAKKPARAGKPESPKERDSLELPKPVKGAAKGALEASRVVTKRGKRLLEVLDDVHELRKATKLPAEQLAQAPLAERAELLHSLTAGLAKKLGNALLTSHTISQAYRVLPRGPAKQQVILNILESAKDAGEFDYLYSRVDPQALKKAVTGSNDRRVRELCERHHSSAVPGDWDGFFTYLETVAAIRPSGRNSIEFLIDGKEAIPGVKTLLEKRWTDIFLKVFQLQPDEIGKAFVELLGAQAQQDATVRANLDGFGTNGSQSGEDELYKKMGDKGVSYVVNRAPLTFSHLNHEKVLVLLEAKKLRKSKLADAAAVTGGMNIGSHYQGDRSNGAWHDQTMIVRGRAVLPLLESQIAHWERDTGEKLAEDEKARLFALAAQIEEPAEGAKTWVVEHHGGGEDRNIKFGYLRAIATTPPGEHIWIADPYWGDKDIIDELVKASTRGVHVHCVFPEENDQKLMDLTASSLYPTLLEAGIEVLEYPGMSHLKVAVFGGQVVTAGSSNLDARSLEFNDELNLFVQDEKLARQVLERLFIKDLEVCKRIDEHELSLRERLAKKAAPWT